MLQSIRDRSRSWGAKIIVGAVVVTLALFGVESLVGLVGNSGEEIAEVNGEPITRQQLEREVQRAIRSGQVPPGQERALRGQMLEQLISERLLAQYVERGGMHLSEEQLDQVIVSLPEFQNAQGNFDRELFRNRLASAGYTPLSFREQLREDIKRQQLQRSLAASDFTLDSEQERLAELQRQTRDFRYRVLTADDLERDPEISDAAVQQYYEANSEAYRRPEQVKLNYVVLNRQRMAEQVEIEEEALRQAWRNDTTEADRHVSHIMVTYGNARTREEATARLEQALERLEQGEDFAALAAEISDDPSSRDAGGDLGVISRGFFGEAFDEAAFSLAEGEVSGVVETDNALHLLKVTEIDRPPFEEVRDELHRELALARVRDDFNQRVQQLIDQSFAADDLQSIADDLGLTVQHSDWLSRQSAEGVLAEPGVMSAAFSPDVLKEGYNSEVIELDEDRRLVLRVAEHREATTLPLAEVRDQVEQAVRSQQIREALRQRAAELAEQLRTGDDLSLSWQQAEDVSRQGGSDLPAPLVDAAFRLPQPQEGKVIYGQAGDDQRVYLIALERVEAGEPDAETEQFVGRMVEQLRARAVVQGLLDALYDEASIERL